MSRDDEKPEAIESSADDSPEMSLADKAKAEAAAAAGRAAAESLMSGIGRAANGFLDAVERSIFGKVGGAEEQLAKDGEASAFQRLRQEAAEAPKPPRRPTAAEREAAARAQLEAMKSGRPAAPAEEPEPDSLLPKPRKRTL